MILFYISRLKFQPLDQAFFAVVKRSYKSWLNEEVVLERNPTKAAKVLKLMECTRHVSQAAILSCWKKASGTQSIDHEDEEITLELYEVPDETPEEPVIPDKATEIVEEPAERPIKK